METVGYVTLPAKPPAENDNNDDIIQIQQLFDKSRGQYTEPDTGITSCDGGPECSRFIGTDDDDSEIMRFVLHHLSAPSSETLYQLGPRILEFQASSNTNTGTGTNLAPRRAHPIHSSTSSISLFRPLNTTAAWENGSLGIYGLSHHQTPLEFLSSEKRDMPKKELHPDEVLVLPGGCFVQPSPNLNSNTNGNGSGRRLRMVWVGFATRPMFDDMFAPDGFAFMSCVSRPSM